MSARRERLLRAWRRFWRPPRRLRTTPAGRTYLVLCFGVGLGALNTGNNLLYLVLGLQLSIVVASGILSERCVRRVEVRRLLPAAPRARSPFHLAWGASACPGASPSPCRWPRCTRCSARRWGGWRGSPPARRWWCARWRPPRGEGRCT